MTKRLRVAAGSVLASSLTDDPSAVPLGGTAPDARLLPEAQCVIQAGLLHCTTLTHRLGGLCLGIVVRVEDCCVEAAARAEVPPLRRFWTDLMNGHVCDPLALSLSGRHPPPSTPPNLERARLRAPEKLVGPRNPAAIVSRASRPRVRRGCCPAVRRLRGTRDGRFRPGQVRRRTSRLVPASAPNAGSALPPSPASE